MGSFEFFLQNKKKIVSTPPLIDTIVAVAKFAPVFLRSPPPPVKNEFFFPRDYFIVHIVLYISIGISLNFT